MSRRRRARRAGRVSLVALASTALAAALASAAAAQPAELVITGAHLVGSPGTFSYPTTIVVRDGKIAEVRSDQSGPPPPAARTIDARGRVVTAGFWNCHVHFTEPKWSNAGELPEAALSQHLRDMVISHGFTSVVDTGSDLLNTGALRKRIAGGVPGPRIVAASGSFVPEHGSPAYLEVKLPEVTTPDQARRLTQEVLAQGADAIKIFTGSYVGPGPVPAMLLPVVQAVTAEAHGEGKLVVAHPQSLEGVERALDGGVDILAHTAPQGGPWSGELVAKMVEKGMSLIPTLKLWRFELTRAGVPAVGVDRAQAMGVSQLRAFAAANGDVLFGTDLGYMTDYDPAEEYRKMAEAGLSFGQILAALTVNPTRRFGDPAAEGTVEPGKQADLVILATTAPPAAEAFADVAYTIRAGRVLYEAPVQ